MGLISEILTAIFNLEENNNQQQEKEMEKYGLENWQKSYVRKGEQKIFNFEEGKDLEYDDYYYDDDK